MKISYNLKTNGFAVDYKIICVSSNKNISTLQ